MTAVPAPARSSYACAAAGSRARASCSRVSPRCSDRASSCCRVSPAGSRLPRACSSRSPSPRCRCSAIGSLRRLADAEGAHARRARRVLGARGHAPEHRGPADGRAHPRRAPGAAAAAARLRCPRRCRRSSRAIARARRSTPARSCAASEVLATTSGEVEWELVLAAAEEQGERFLVTGAAPETGARRARRPASPSTPASRSSCCAHSTSELAARLTERTGVADRGSSTTRRSSPAKARSRS